MRFIVTLSAFLALAAILPSAAAPPPKAQYKIPPKSSINRPVASVTSQGAIPLLKQGLAALQNHQDAQAEQAFKRAIAIMSPVDSNLVVAVDHLAHFYYQKNRYPEALIYAKKAIPLIVKRHGAHSLREADSIYLVANIQHQLNDTVNAEAGYKRSIQIYELPQNSGKYSRCYSLALENLGSIVGKSGQFEKALTYYKKALTIRQQHADANDGTLLENIGISYQNYGQPDEAIGYYEQALALYQQNSAAHQEAIQRVSFKLANLQGKSIATQTAPKYQNGPQDGQYDGQYYEAAKQAYNVQRNYAEAARLFQLALDQVTRFYPQEHKVIASVEAVLGKSLYYADDVDAALPYLEKAYAAQSNIMKPDEPDLLSTMAALGMAYNGKGDYTQAQKALQSVKSHADPKSPLYASVLMTLADNLCHQGNFQEAKWLYDEALVIYSAKGPDGAQQIKSIQYQLALLDKMFKSQQGIGELIGYSKDGLRRWSLEKGPIFIFLNSGSGLPQWQDRYSGLLQKAFREWQEALPGLAGFEYVDTPEKADVVVNWTDRPIQKSDLQVQSGLNARSDLETPSDLETKVGLHRLATVRSFFLSSEIIIALQENGKLRTDAELYATALHEIGHMLGLQHSSDLSDVMAAVGNYAIPVQGWPSLSGNDIKAARVLYQQPAAVTNPPGITLAEFRKFDALVQPGMEALKSHNYKQANRIFEVARTVYSQDSYVNYFSGLSAFQAGDYKEAREIFETLRMPQSTAGFSVDSQLGLIYVELGHKYNKWGRKNKASSNEFYEKGVVHLQQALRNPEVAASQKEYLADKLREGLNRKRPEPVYTWEYSGPMYRRF